MEQEFYRDEFEQLLKDTTEDFKMYPSRKVWHSIYNDLHPDRKWPSLAVCLLLLTTILYVGVTNNNAINGETRKNNAVATLNVPVENTSSVTSVQSTPAAKNKGAIVRDINQARRFYDDLAISDAPPELIAVVTPTTITEKASDANNIEANTVNVAEETATIQTKSTMQSSVENIEIATTSNHSNSAKTVALSLAIEKNENASVSPDSELPVANDENTASDKIEILQADNSISGTDKNLLLFNKNLLKDTREREWIEDFAFYNKKKPSRLLKGLSTQFYVTPSIGYRVMFKNKRYENINNNALVANSAARNEETTKEVNQQAAMNMEAGFGLLKDLGKKWKLKGALQFNYTDFITYAQKLDHPTQTSVVVNDPITGYLSFAPQSASYANNHGKNSYKLHNKTIQFSIPVGMDYRIINNRLISWYVGATIQPTYITGGYSYLLSADNNYFVEDQSMIRKWNLNGAVESFVSIKTKSGTNINLGPQFRYQLISTFNKEYIHTQKPYSIGFKIGFTRPL